MRSSSRSSSKGPRRSRSAKKTSPKRGDAAGTEKVRVMTYNCRGFFDRYLERSKLLKKTMTDAAPDVLGCQEVMVNGAGMDEDLAGKKKKASSSP